MSPCPLYAHHIWTPTGLDINERDQLVHTYRCGCGATKTSLATAASTKPRG